MAEIRIDVVAAGDEKANASLGRLDATADKLERSARKLKDTAASLARTLRDAGFDDAAKDASKLDKELKDVSRSADRADRSLKSTGRAAAGASSDFRRVNASVAAAIPQLIALVGAGQAVRSIFDNIVEFDKLSGQLETISASSAEATATMAGLRVVATELPVELNELADSFIRLRSRGFDATADSLRVISDIAVGLGGTFAQTTEAILDLAVGQTRRIEELGIVASQADGQVTIAFGGISRTVNKTADEIQAAMRDIALENFAGASAEQMQRLTGQISNLSDAFFELSVAIGEAGVYSGVANLIQVLTELTSQVGALIGGSGVGELARQFGEIRAALDIIPSPAEAFIRWIGSAGDEATTTADKVDVLLQKLAAFGDAGESLARSPLSASRIFAETKAELAAIESSLGAGGTDLSAFDEIAGRAGPPPLPAVDKKAEAAAKKAARQAQIAANKVAAQAATEIASTLTLTEALSAELDEINSLAGKSAEFSGEPVIRSQVAALEDYAAAQAAVAQADIDAIRRQIEAAETVDQRVSAMADLNGALSRVRDQQLATIDAAYEEGVISQEAALRAAAAATEQYAEATAGLNMVDYVDQWERANRSQEETLRLTIQNAEAMLRYGADTETVARVIAEAEEELAELADVGRWKQLGEVMEGVWENVGRSIQGSLADSFYEIFRQGEFTFRALGRSVVDIMGRAAAEVAAAFVIDSTVGIATGIAGGIGSGVGAKIAGGVAGEAAGNDEVISAITSAATTVVAPIVAGSASVLSGLGTTASAIVGALGPVGLAVVGVTAAVGILGDDLGKLLEDIVDAIFDALDQLIDAIFDAVEKMIKGIASAVGKVGKEAAGGVVDIVTAPIKAIGSIFHDGGIVGQTAAPTRSVPASVFAAAPRYHSGGLMPGEVPIIAKRGEAVVPLKNGAIPVEGSTGGQPIINIYGAPWGTQTRRRGPVTDIMLGTVDRELAARVMSGSSAL